MEDYYQCDEPIATEKMHNASVTQQLARSKTYRKNTLRATIVATSAVSFEVERQQLPKHTEHLSVVRIIINRRTLPKHQNQNQNDPI